MDKNTILAIALVGIAWFAWQSYLNKKYPHLNKPVAESNSTQLPGSSDVQKNLVDGVSVNSQADNKPTSVLSRNSLGIKPNSEVELNENLIEIGNEYSQFQLSNFGLGLRGVELKKYTRRDSTPIQFARNSRNENENLFELSLIGSNSPLQFKVEKLSETTFVGTAKWGNTTIERRIEYQPESYSFKNIVKVMNADDSFKGFYLSIPERIESYSSGSFLIPSYEHQEFVVVHGDKKEERIIISGKSENLTQTFQNVSVISVSDQYFSTALSDQSELIPEVEVITNFDAKLAKLMLAYKVATPKDQHNFQFVTYAGPKTQSTLEKASPSLVSILNFGFFGSIGKLLLSLLKWFYSFVGNWGVSIILLTVLVRFLVLPFNIASYKSMKKMQKIQPMLQSIRERYKEDPTKMNLETMNLMKVEKVNPIGGCLPMLLQMPIFFALFQVLGNSIEIYQAPFLFWIHDLSLKDPYYVLPILMGVSMFIQSKITPTTMDPQQAKIMQFMPVIFSLMMVSLPSGLTLYTFISTIFGILQQQFFTRDSKTTSLTNAKEVKA